MSDHTLSGDEALHLRHIHKAELHVHLDGSLRASTVLDIAREESIPNIPDQLHMLEQCVNRANAGTLSAYLDAFSYTLAVMQSQAALNRVAYEFVEDNAEQGIVYSEVRFCPLLHTRRGLRADEVLDIVCGGLSLADRAFGISTAVIVSALRDASPHDSELLAELAVAFRSRGVVGFDLAGPEEGFLPSLHLRACKLAKKAGLGLTIHAGEGAGWESIADAIYRCEADRIGHGCRLLDKPSLAADLAKHQIVIECCPSSNVHTGAVRNFAAHPLGEFIKRGLCATVNTDNRLMSDTSLTREMLVSRQKLGLSADDIEYLRQNAFRGAFRRVPTHQ